MSPTLYLVRHGEVDAEGIIYGQLDVPLSAHGLEQAAAAAAALADIHLDAVHCSDLDRAVQGARLIAGGRGLTPAPDPAFREMNLGQLEGVSHDEARGDTAVLKGKRYRDMWRYRFPGGGENMADIEARAMPALERALAAHPDGAIALVAHNSTNRVVLGRALGLPMRDVFDFAQDYACVNVIQYKAREEGGWSGRVLLMNWTPGAPAGAPVSGL